MASLDADMPDSAAETGQQLRYKFLVLLRFDGPRRLRDIVGFSVRQASAEPVFPDEVLKGGAVWVDQLVHLVRTSDAVIADVTEADPNVLFELGMAHVLGKPLVLLLDGTATTNLPSDLVGYQALTYSPDDSLATEFGKRLSRTLRQITQRREMH